MFIYNVFLTFIVKRLINGIHKTCLKHSITNGFRTHHFLTFAKRFLSNVCKTQKCLLGTFFAVSFQWQTVEIFLSNYDPFLQTQTVTRGVHILALNQLPDAYNEIYLKD